MPHRSIAERVKALDRLRSSDRYVDARLEVYASTGTLLFALGGCWDDLQCCYVERECTPRIVRLKESQDKAGAEIAEYIGKRLAGDDARINLLLLIGDRGGGKTWMIAFLLIVVAIALPGTWEICVSITAKQNREVKDAIAQIADPRWIGQEVDDFRDPRTVFLTKTTCLWLTSKNPKALRQAQLQFELVAINEGQDQRQKIFTNSIAATRKSGGLCAVATNPPTEESGDGDWVALLYQEIEAANDTDGSACVLESRLNDAVNQASLRKIERWTRVVDPQQADADSLGIIKLAGAVGYQGFSRLARSVDTDGHWLAGHIGEQSIDWTDITHEVSGFDYVGGADFQTDPGSCCAIGKIFRTADAERVLWIRELVATNGTEQDLTLALHSRGYYPGNVDWDGRNVASLLLVGDATGARQNAQHRKRDPYSFIQLRSDGWSVEPPEYYGPKKTPWNPLIDDSRKQMKGAFLSGLIVLSPACLEPTNGFPSLVDSFQRTKVTSAGKFVKKGHYTHGPDGVRYLAWRYLPRAQVAAPPAPDRETAKRIRGIRLFGRR